MYLWPHQLQKTNDKKSNLCCMKKRDYYKTLLVLHSPRPFTNLREESPVKGDQIPQVLVWASKICKHDDTFLG